MSCGPMMVLTSGALKTCTRVLGTCESSYIGRLVRLYFMFKARGPQETAGHAVAAAKHSRSGGRIQSSRTHDAPEPSPAGRQDSKL
jgi:hypothetical protein